MEHEREFELISSGFVCLAAIPLASVGARCWMWRRAELALVVRVSPFGRNDRSSSRRRAKRAKRWCWWAAASSLVGQRLACETHSLSLAAGVQTRLALALGRAKLIRYSRERPARPATSQGWPPSGHAGHVGQPVSSSHWRRVAAASAAAAPGSPHQTSGRHLWPVHELSSLNPRDLRRRAHRGGHSLIERVQARSGQQSRWAP